MRFPVDAQLPPQLCRWLEARGHQAEHLFDLGLHSATDDPHRQWLLTFSKLADSSTERDQNLHFGEKISRRRQLPSGSRKRDSKMLLRFSVENFGCFRDEVTLSMVASSDGKHPDHLIKGPRSGRPVALKAAGIYGANGHGKTQLVEAISFLKDLISDGTSGDEPLPIKPFRLSRASQAHPSKFVANFRVGNIDFEYGIVVNSQVILEEWLFERRNVKEQLVFQRVTTSEDGREEINVEFGPGLKKEKSNDKRIDPSSFLDFVAFGTRKNQPFLTEAVERNVKYLKDAFEWFAYTLQVVPADSNYSHLHHRAKHQESFLSFLGRFVAEADTGIKDLVVQDTPLSADLLRDMPEEARERLQKEVAANLTDENMMIVATPDGTAFVVEKRGDGEPVASRIMTRHESQEGDLVTFRVEDESSGTRRLLDLVPMLSHLNEVERVYVIDELDRKLHPLLAVRLIENLLACTKGQVVFTTHNTLLLNLNLLRRDEIWFVQKLPSGTSELYSLADFRIRPDLDVRKGYLHGRFGAIPFLGNLEDLGWCPPSQPAKPSGD